MHTACNRSASATLRTFHCIAPCPAVGCPLWKRTKAAIAGCLCSFSRYRRASPDTCELGAQDYTGRFTSSSSAASSTHVRRTHSARLVIGKPL
eukprot:6206920-Pleurochrysis_carterae.AAC.3